MMSTTRHRDRTCLTADDLEGLNFLYPSCVGAAEPVSGTGLPMCIKAQSRSGYLRLAYATGLPYICVSLFILALQVTTFCNHLL